MIIVDTSAIVAAADRRDRWHAPVVAAMQTNASRLVVPASLLAEIDYMLDKRVGKAGSRAFLRDLAAGNFAVAGLDTEDFRAILGLTDRYADLAPGLADLSIIALAHRFRTNRILTFDVRHFRAMTISGGAFELLPLDTTGDA